MTAPATTDGARTLRALHHGREPGDPLVLPGPWDAASARVFADAGFPALATPSAGIAASLGHQDGQTPPQEMFATIARIVRAVDIPVSADVEAGYGLAPEELVERLLETGAAGCNLEDFDRAAGRLVEPGRQADLLAAVRAEAGEGLVINARVDTFVHGGPDIGPEAAATAAIERARLYVAAGADCVYPILAPPELLPRLASAIDAPLNAAAFDPDGPSPRELDRLGATRITFGPRLLRQTMAAAADLVKRLDPAP
ncbi:isocitrate lyase/phosphoenolpyruvate mutase family protein [Streptomyces sp. 8ZJF_21]|uniref:isocitrate lyase/PEP mutase family protein n=1 Tax=Streptomyces sp. 8ZJF_21 TaxID=2903141 RepID=UPI001E57B2C9|nr:isocitrate lyase/phosphoenolpyruvate mutase family protein [Streptomyces sp. 8ZJF_21]MCD9594527.1 isocitrate lyase/phosphoenolpyruvate mutase family protein [Streptomyces sp. 8ZJF_21]